MLQQWRRRSDPDGKDGFSIERLEASYAELSHTGWPRALRRLRKELPGGLYTAALPAAARRGSWVVIAKVGRTPVGYAWAVDFPGEPGSAYVEEVAVLSRYQRQGIGTRLVQEVARWMVELRRFNLSILPVTGSAWVVKAGFGATDSATYRADARYVVAQLDESMNAHPPAIERSPIDRRTGADQ